MSPSLPHHDRTLLRDLAKELAEIAARPEIAVRRALWIEHNALRSKEPLMLVFPEGSWAELIPEHSLGCESAKAREMEFSLRSRIYTFRHFQDDSVIEAEWVVPAYSSSDTKRHTGWGLEPVKVPSSDQRGAFRIEPVLRDWSDLKKLRYPDLLYDPVDHQRRLEEAQELFGDILTVKRVGVAHISYHLWSQYIYLRGETAYMTDMLDHPEQVHEIMSFFVAGHRHLLAQMVELNLLSLNNDNTYHSSGGNGYTDELPKPGFDPRQVRPCDLWASAESQELAGVSPRMHRQFALEYERALLEPFGLTGYGCCEDLSRKLEDVCALPNMRRISISPFADVGRSAEKLKRNFIFSWKPQPAHLVGEFNPPALRAYVRHTLEVCAEHGCVLEMILKDTHTCENHPERFDRWTAIAREEIQRQREIGCAL